jgi:hypothetical protein
MLADRGVLVRVATARATPDEDEKTGVASLDGVMPDGQLAEQEPRTDAVLVPEDLLSDDDVPRPAPRTRTAGGPRPRAGRRRP